MELRSISGSYKHQSVMCISEDLIPHGLYKWITQWSLEEFIMLKESPFAEWHGRNMLCASPALYLSWSQCQGYLQLSCGKLEQQVEDAEKNKKFAEIPSLWQFSRGWDWSETQPQPLMEPLQSLCSLLKHKHVIGLHVHEFSFSTLPFPVTGSKVLSTNVRSEELRKVIN